MKMSQSGGASQNPESYTMIPRYWKASGTTLNKPIRNENEPKQWSLTEPRKLHQDSTLLESKWNHVEHTDKKLKCGKAVERPTNQKAPPRNYVTRKQVEPR